MVLNAFSKTAKSKKSSIKSMNSSNTMFINTVSYDNKLSHQTCVQDQEMALPAISSSTKRTKISEIDDSRRPTMVDSA